MAKQNSLGRGLDALISSDDIRTVGSSSISEIELSKIRPNPDQPRHEFDPEALEELASSIRQIGIVQPVTLRKMNDGSYQIISGERRWRAATAAGLQRIPAYIKTAEDDAVMEMALIENIQREDLNAIEVALACQKLLEVYHLTHEKLSERLGKSRTSVTNYLRLLKLPAEIQMGLQNRKIEMAHARSLVALDSPTAQIAIYEDILRYGYSARQVEELVRNYGKTAEEKAGRQKTKKISRQYASLQQLLSDRFGTKVKLNVDENGKGNISIPFKSEKKLEEILAILDKIL